MKCGELLAEVRQPSPCSGPSVIFLLYRIVGIMYHKMGNEAIRAARTSAPVVRIAATRYVERLRGPEFERGMDKRIVNDKSQVQVIARAAAILRALENESLGLSLGQIAQRVNLARSTVQRIVAALEAENLVMSASPNGRVKLGPTILRLAAAVQTDFVTFARPFLVSLSNELRETVDLAIVRKDHMVFIDQVIGSQRLRLVSAVGETFPLHCTANGKAYLAELTDAEIERLIGRNYEPKTSKTITRLSALFQDLKKARKAGYAIDREEHTEGICAVGVALKDLLGNYVAISVPVPAQRFSGAEARIAEKLSATKLAMQTHLASVAA